MGNICISDKNAVCYIYIHDENVHSIFNNEHFMSVNLRRGKLGKSETV